MEKAAAGGSALSKLWGSQVNYAGLSLASSYDSNAVSSGLWSRSLVKGVYSLRLVLSRRTLRVTFAYRAVSELTAMVIAEVIPVRLLLGNAKPSTNAKKKIQRRKMMRSLMRVL